jgi:two-component system sensor histidine kinase BaeS
MRSLRSRLILSHILPLLVVVPLVGVTLIYVIESQVLLKNLTEELTQQATQVADAARSRADIWQDTTQAQAFIDDLHVPGGVMLLSPDGQMLASNEHVAPADSGVILQTSATEILLPVRGEDQQVVGIVRINQQLARVYRHFEQLRYLIIGMLGIELLFGVLLGLSLALKLEKCLQQVAQAILSVATDHELTMLPEQGPDEIRTVLQAFNAMTHRLQDAQDIRKRLLANLVHELGRPLGALRSAVRALLNGADQDPAFRQELLLGIDAQLQRLEPLLNNLAQLHDTVLDVPRLKRRPVALCPWLTEVLSPWRAAAQEKNLNWCVTIPDSLPALEIDPDRLAQAVGNLLSNAIKFTPPQGTVAVSVAVQGEQLRITVQDSGPGITPEEQPRIFEPFYRGSKRFAQGMGLGLTIARDLIAAHAGQIELRSQPGVGSQFTICLPCG